MKRSVMLLGLSLGLLTAGRAPGLQPGGGPPDQDRAKSEAGSTAVYEDVEIMRRLLDRAVQEQQANRSSGPAQALAFSPDGQRYTAAQSPAVSMMATTTGRLVMHRDASLGGPGLAEVSGVYLKGYGAVFTLTLPPQPLTTGGELPKTGKGLSEWERTRRELHGERVEATPALRESKPRLDHTILRLLHRNGHFLHLAEGEKVTVVVTFAGAEPFVMDPGQLAVLRAHVKGQPLDAKQLDALRDYVKAHPEARQYADYLARTAQAQGMAPTTPGGGGAGPSMQASGHRDYELLGDLQLKQGRLKEAIAAYQQAIGQQPDPKRATAVYGKLAQGYLLLQQGSAAPGQRHIVEKAIAYLQKIQQEASGTTGASTDSGRHAQLIISVPRTVLERSVTASWSAEEFRRQASVEFRRLDPTVGKGS